MPLQYIYGVLYFEFPWPHSCAPFFPYSTVLRSSYVVIKYAAFKELAGQGFTVFKFLEKSILKM